jgi:hypothetical protein
MGDRAKAQRKKIREGEKKEIRVYSNLSPPRPVNNLLPFSIPFFFSSGKMNSHEAARANEEKNLRAREAFGIRKDYDTGQAFDRELQAERKEKRRLVCCSPLLFTFFGGPMLLLAYLGSKYF